MVECPSDVNGTTLYVSAGAEFLNVTEIWVMTAGFEAVCENITVMNY